MRDLAAAHSAPAPQAPARNPPPTPRRHDSTASLETFNSHRRIKRPALGDRRVYRPGRREPLARIDEAPRASAGPPGSGSPMPGPRPHSKSLQCSTDFSSTRPALRSRSNVSADTGRSVPVCNQSHDASARLDYGSAQYDAHYGGRDDDSEEDAPASMTDRPVPVPLDRLAGSYLPYPEYAYYDCAPARYEWNCKRKPKNNNLFLAFMY